MGDERQVPIAKGVTLETSPDGKFTAVLFKVPRDAGPMEPGVIGAALQNKEMSRLAALLIEQSQKIAGSVIPKPPRKLTTTPIMASHLTITKGRSESEAIVAFVVGNMVLSFAIELSMIHEQCKNLQSKIVVKEGRPKTQ